MQGVEIYIFNKSIKTQCGSFMIRKERNYDH